ncbi:Site-specific recombinase XerC [Roseovarius marisflavi]|uniref:Site-specific recombinase XerC n=1 Tax=Roseovarius marisflavi TaxID=1054996 RepID=A0A1M7CH25_9RHOB|nr:tyrosine-type recombinase/integrase [Roseovarius marisflavi]SHL66485.1 Site-specific recombinase XerC [Roseovarius marisflavi]
MTPLPLSAQTQLTAADQDALTDLYVRGTPENTLRAYERDLVYITAWRKTVFGSNPEWPEHESVALRFILDHARDLAALDPSESARMAAEALIVAGLRKSLACPAPATLDRRIASWRAFHRMKNLPSPFDAPMVRQARAKARRAAARPKAAKSAKPIVRDMLKQMLATCEPGLRGTRDRAILLFGWASGGRRRSEITGLRREDIDLEEFETRSLAWIRLTKTKTTTRETTPKLVLKGVSARALVAWIDAAEIEDGPLFRPISKSGRPLKRGITGDGIYQIVKRRLELAGLPRELASPHGLRSGFLTQAALDGVPIQVAMRLSLHASLAQASAYYADVDLDQNEATDLLE